MRRRARRARLDRLLGDPRLRVITLSTLVVIVGLGIAFRLPPSLVLVLVLSVLALAVVIRLIGSAELGWPLRRDEGSSHGWVGVAMLSHSLAVADSSPWEFDRVIRPRLARLATAALSREDAEWDTAQARELLSARVHDELRPDAVGDGPAPDAPTLSESGRTALAAATLDVLEALERREARTTVATGNDVRTADDVRTAS